MSADKYASIFSRQMEAIVYIFKLWPDGPLGL